MSGFPSKTAFMGVRVPYAQWLPEQRFCELIELLQRHPRFTDEVSFFSSSIHPVLPLAEIEQRMTVLKSRIAATRAAGYRPGINFLSTIGHVDEYLDDALQGEYIPLTGPDGKRAQGSFCPNDPNFREYIKSVYIFVAEANPDFIWIDDDVRLANHAPVGFSCFCDNCLRLFNESNHTDYTRISLTHAFDHGTAEQKMTVRRQWQSSLALTMCRVLTLIQQSVHGIRPDIQLGLMTGEQFYEGYDFAGYAELLSSAAAGPAMWRPGGGFYADDAIGGIAKKCHCIGRQIVGLPENVVNIQSEIENFPYQVLKKAPHSVALETAAYIAAGCTGAAFNILGMFDQSLRDYEPLIRRLAESRPFFDLLVGTLGRSPLTGVWAAWKKDVMVADHLASGKWFDEGIVYNDVNNSLLELAEIGLPMTYSPENAAVTLLPGSIAAAYSHDELEKMLSHGVYLDGKALEVLAMEGVDEYAGFKVDFWVDKDCAEFFTADPLNGDDDGTRRDCIQAFWRNPCAALRVENASARILGRKIGRIHSEPSFPCLGAYENRLGGRVAVAGYSPWTFLQDRNKTVQLKRLFRWLSKDTLPGYVESCHKANLWIRDLGGGRLAVVLINSSHEPAANLSLLIKTTAVKAEAIAFDCSSQPVTQAGSDGPYRRFVVPAIAPWSMVLILI